MSFRPHNQPLVRSAPSHARLAVVHRLALPDHPLPSSVCHHPSPILPRFSAVPPYSHRFPAVFPGLPLAQVLHMLCKPLQRLCPKSLNSQQLTWHPNCTKAEQAPGRRGMCSPVLTGSIGQPRGTRVLGLRLTQEWLRRGLSQAVASTGGKHCSAMPSQTALRLRMRRLGIARAVHSGFVRLE